MSAGAFSALQLVALLRLLMLRTLARERPSPARPACDTGKRRRAARRRQSVGPARGPVRSITLHETGQ